MSPNKYIIVLISFVFVLNCAPPKNIRQKNNTSQYKSDTQNKPFMYWHSNEHNIDYEGINSLECNRDNFHNQKKYEKRLKISSITNNNIRNKDSDNNFDRKNNNYQEKIQKSNDNRRQINNYKVKKGDNLTKISKTFNVSINELVIINKIQKEDKIFAGMILKIPDGTNNNKPQTAYLQNQEVNKHPNFTWPIKHIHNTKRDGIDGVKPIGIIITGERGTGVFSSADGIVTKVGNMRGFGSYVILKHINQYLTIYSNLRDIKVNEGEKIERGKCIGRLDGNRLHFQIGRSGKPQDPFIYLSNKS
ncbi:MAG: peptidoglycan DD-metalloendopeptidase family protein [Spirochaetes bacterium]|nr:peptidoglycan DD-metalloendopeptidase family protein [Spirochaetota bacterium]